MQLCSGKTKAGVPCRAPAGSQGMCFFHANPDKAHTLGQIGGRKNRSQLPEPIAVGTLTAAGLLGILAKVMEDLLSNKIAARNAGAIAQLCNSTLRILPIADLEARVRRLERQRAEEESPTSVDTDPTESRTQDESRGETDAEPRHVLATGSGNEGDKSNDESGEGEKG
jgi:hypothetical protein